MNINSRTSKINFTGFASGAIASFTGLRAAPIIVRSQINAIQQGSGDPAPDNIRPIIGVSECNVVRCGVNVWDEEFESGYYDVNDNGVPKPSGSWARSKNAIKVSSNYSYYALASHTNFVVLFYDINNNLISYNGALKNTAFTPPANTVWMRFYGTPSGFENDTCINYPSTDTDYHAYSGNTYTIQLDDTCYGGSLNVTTGMLTVDKGVVDMGTLNWVYDSTYNRFNTTYSLIKPSGGARTAKIMCSVLTPITDGRPVSQVPNNSIYQGTSYSISAHDNRFTDATLFTNAVTGQTIVFPLANPITVQLTPAEIWQTIGSNSIFSDAGNVEVYYVTI